MSERDGQFKQVKSSTLRSSGSSVESSELEARSLNFKDWKYSTSVANEAGMYPKGFVLKYDWEWQSIPYEGTRDSLVFESFALSKRICTLAR